MASFGDAPPVGSAADGAPASAEVASSATAREVPSAEDRLSALGVAKAPRLRPPEVEADAGLEDVPVVWQGREPSEPPGQDQEPVAASRRPRLRALSFNILADGLAKGSAEMPLENAPCPGLFEQPGVGGVVYRADFASCAKVYKFAACVRTLAWNRRWPILRSLILALDPDLIGLQEVDLMEGGREHLQPHDKEIRRDLRRSGYEGTFACKRGRAVDGVALFWRSSRLRQAGRTETWNLGESVHVALAQPLRLDNAWAFTAVATHLKAGLTVDAERIRFKQATILLERLARHSDAIVLADLNSHCRRTEATDVPKFGEGQPVEPRAYPLLTTSMQSAYSAVLGQEPSFTCWGGWLDREVRLVIDYIFTKGPLLTPQRVLQLPTAEEVLRHPTRLPNRVHPSDHVPLAAEFDVGGDSEPTQPWQ